MSWDHDGEEAPFKANPSFATTHWSVVLAAGSDSTNRADNAREKLCSSYWYPVYAYVRRQGFEKQGAEDLTQDFFSWLLESGHLRVADQEIGKFRSFLLVRLKHFLADERKKARAQKRGGGQTLVSWDGSAAEERYCLEPAMQLNGEKIFDAGWALTVLERTLFRLREEYRAAGRVELFEQIRCFQIVNEPEHSYAEIAGRLAMSTSATKTAIYRLRQRHADLLRDEIAQTVATPPEVDQEIRYLVSILSQ